MMMMMMLVGTSGVMQRLQCHGRKRSSQLFTRETETDGYNYHKIPHQMNMLMIIILCCIVITTSIITKVKVTTSHVLVMNRTQGSNLYFCYCAPSQYYSCNWNGRNIPSFFEQIVSWQNMISYASYNHHIWEEHVIIGESQVTKKGSPLSKIGSGIVGTTQHSAISSCQLQICTAVSNWN